MCFAQKYPKYTKNNENINFITQSVIVVLPINLNKGIAPKPMIEKRMSFVYLSENGFKNFIKTTKTHKVKNNCGTNHSGAHNKSWCPFRNGVTKKLFKETVSPKNVPQYL